MPDLVTQVAEDGASCFYKSARPLGGAPQQHSRISDHTLERHHRKRTLELRGKWREQWDEPVCSAGEDGAGVHGDMSFAVIVYLLDCTSNALPVLQTPRSHLPRSHTCVRRMLSNSSCVSAWSFVMSALAFIPKTSGAGVSGRFLV